MKPAASLALMSWADFAALMSGDPFIVPIPGMHELAFAANPAATTLALRIPKALVPDGFALPLEDVILVSRTITGVHWIDIQVTRVDLFEPFYAFASAIADQVQLRGADGPTAVQRALAQWKTLLQGVAVLTPEQQLGLWGELWLLQRLASMMGPSSIAAWTGPLKEPHDFRLLDREIEVKTTRSETRTHTINGLHQLAPSPGLDLLVLSLQVEPAGMGPGVSLAEQVAESRALMAADAASLSKFEDSLTSAGYRDDRSMYYQERWTLRTHPTLVPVTGDFPAITAANLPALGPHHTARISDLTYRLNLEGLGWIDGTEQFLAVLPEER